LVRMDGAETRKERIAQIARTVQARLYESKETGYISLKKTVAQIMIDTGLTKNKVMEYLQLQNDAGQFELNEAEDKITRPLTSLT
jgi:hypothetical protein